VAAAWGDEPAWSPDAEPFPHLRWRWRRWRARHYVWAAEWALVQAPSARTLAACYRARDYLAHVEAARP
jgi:hypothetical protein